ncbi:MAG: hypothetical protein NC393_01065 [Clostridium sp.]|nr:hypothetical protein [Clostridium sp.]MCM1208370.1 hypothetical protein [Ruminococcus sp.]
MGPLKFLYKLEAKYGKYAINNLSLWIVIIFALSYFLAFFFPNVYVMLIFSPYEIFVEHQFWRIFTWIFTMPGEFDIFTLVMLFFYYSIGRSIELSIGTFMYNLYIFSGLFFTTVGITVTSAICYFTINDTAGFIAFMGGEIAGFYLTYFMTISIFLGYALVNSNSFVMLNFLIPVKTTWLAFADVIWLLYYFVKLDNIVCRVAIVASVLNCVIFYYISKRYTIRRKPLSAYIKRKSSDRDKGRQREKTSGATVERITVPEGVTRHKCAICGKTEKDDDMLEFRFCSKCKGNYEYCSEHLFTHEHVK